MRALPAMAHSLRLMTVIRTRSAGIDLFQAFPLLVLRQNTVTLCPVALLLAI